MPSMVFGLFLLALIVAPVEAQTDLSAPPISSIQQRHEWQAHVAQVTSLVFVPDTDHLVSTSSNGTLQRRPIAMWHVTRDEVETVTGAFENVAGAGNIPHIQRMSAGRTLAAGFGGSATIWDAPTGRAIARIPQTWATSVASVPYRGQVIGGENGVVGLWSTNLPANYREREALPEEFIFTPNQTQLITAVQIEQPVHQILVDDSTGHILVLTSTGELYQYMLLGDSDAHLNLNLENRIPTASSDRINDNALAVLHPQNPHIAYVKNEGEVVVYDYDTRRPLNIYTLPDSVGCIAYVPDSSFLIIGDSSNRGRLHLFDTETHEAVTRFSTGQPISSCAFDADGFWLATGHDNGEVGLWDIRRSR